MTMRRFVIPFILFMAASALIPAQGFRAQRDVSISADETVRENVLAWRGHVELRGTLEESLFVVGGHARISGTVKKDVIGFSADITLEPGAVIQGELLMIGGSLQKGEGVRIDGGHLHFRYDLKRLRSSLHPFFSASSSLGFFRAAKIIIWFVITLLTFMLFPRSVISAETILVNRNWRMGIAGLAALLGFITLTVISLLLSFVIIGIPLLFGLILIWFAVLVLGRTVVFYAIGSRLARRIGYSGSNVPLILLTGTLVFGALKFIPVAGTIVLLLLNLLEIGTGATYLIQRFRRRSTP